MGHLSGYPVCADCACLLDNPAVKRLAAPVRGDRLHPQRESLFDALSDARSESRYEDDPRAEPGLEDVKAQQRLGDGDDDA